jgi:hypothetical protein
MHLKFEHALKIKGVKLCNKLTIKIVIFFGLIENRI